MAKKCRALSLLTRAVGAFILTAGCAMAAYPDKPVVLYVPLAAGSTADILARTLQPELSKALGATVVVENRPGAGGSVAMQSAAKAAPDGYTLVLGATPTWAINLTLYKNVGYDPLKNFVPVAFLAGGSNVMVVNGKSPYRNVLDVVAKMKEKPGAMAFSSGGNGTSHHLSSVLLNSATQTQARHIPYRGAPQGVTAVIAGEVDFGFYNTPSVLPLIKSGQLKALAVTSVARSPLLPEVPTMQEAGVPGYEVSIDFGLMAPAGTPAAIVEKLNAAARKVVEMPEVKKTLEQQGYDSYHDYTPAQFTQFIQRDQEKWTPLVRQSGASVD